MANDFCLLNCDENWGWGEGVGDYLINYLIIIFLLKREICLCVCCIIELIYVNLFGDDVSVSVSARVSVVCLVRRA